MNKAGPSIMRMALYQAGDVGRRWDPQLAAVYYREMIYHGKNHRRAMGAVMRHLGARVLTVPEESRPCELEDAEDNLINKDYARRVILAKYQVSEQICCERRRHNRKTGNTVGSLRKGRETAIYRTNKQPELFSLYKSKQFPMNKPNEKNKEVKWILTFIRNSRCGLLIHYFVMFKIV